MDAIETLLWMLFGAVILGLIFSSYRYLKKRTQIEDIDNTVDTCKLYLHSFSPLFSSSLFHKLEPSPFSRFITILMVLTKAYIKTMKFEGFLNVCKSIIFSQ